MQLAVIIKSKLIIFACSVLLNISCTDVNRDVNTRNIAVTDTLNQSDVLPGPKFTDSSSKHSIIIHAVLPSVIIDTSKTSADSIVSFAETLIGTPYKYGSADPAQGFDCSGFITYVFNHFNIKVPRSSIDFTNVGTDVSIKNARRGDIILFTGTDSTEKFVGHMGIVTVNANDSLEFIHSTSGKAHGVVITTLNTYYKGRFVKVIRLFKQ